MTGVPQAIASIITRPNGSGQSIGNSRRERAARNVGFLGSLISPMNSTPGRRAAARSPRRNTRWSARSTLAAIFSGMPLAAGDADGAVGRFLRANAAEEREIGRLRPAAASAGSRAGRGGPCRPSRACGSGRRWASEIETTGTSGKSAKTGCSSGRSSRPCSVVTNGVALAAEQRERTSSRCGNAARRTRRRDWRTASSMQHMRRDRCPGYPGRGAARCGQTGSSRAEVAESPLANSVTSWPSATSSSVKKETTRSVPPYSFGGTAS